MVLKVRNVYKSFHSRHHEKKVLQNISFTAQSGNLILINGKSGAGKSVLLSLLAGIEKPDSGSIYFNDCNLPELSQKRLSRIRATGIRLIFQNHNLIESWNVLENMIAGNINNKMTRKEKIDLAFHLLTLFDIKEYHNYTPARLSMGQQLRVTIARALMVKPELLLADEPTGELDNETGELIIQHLTKLAHTEKLSVIVTSHGLFPQKSADKVFLLKNTGLTRE
ncbi:MAG: ATP-binding cassette domain-containing protein [Spirochaetales bacterium]|nr:ATP-binding cassette domain-containing protein [Spirochaetales bacterium]